jgi:Putative Ig domain
VYGLPPGMGFSAATERISGKATQAGTFGVVVEVTRGAAAWGYAVYRFTVA